jgi:hypothetical protein
MYANVKGVIALKDLEEFRLLSTSTKLSKHKNVTTYASTIYELTKP